VALSSGLGSTPTAGALPLEHAVPAWLVQATAIVETILLAASLVIVVVTLARARSTGLARAAWLRLAGMVLWLVLPVVLTIRHSFPVQTHYLLPIYPAPFLLIGAATRLVPPPLPLFLLTGVVATALIQTVAAASAIQHLAVTDDVCYGTSLRAASAVADEVLSLDAQANSRHTSIELDAGDALPTAYLVRGAVPEVDLAGEGNVGLGQHSAIRSPVESTPTAFTGIGPADLHYSNGIHLISVAYATEADASQLIHFAITWTTGPETAPNRPLVWNVELHDPNGRMVFDQSGVDHLSASLSGATIVSWFSIDAPAELAAPLPAGAYSVSVQLVDAFDSRPIGLTTLSTATSWRLGPIGVNERRRCA
jgi:hypothetical protein